MSINSSVAVYIVASWRLPVPIVRPNTIILGVISSSQPSQFNTIWFILENPSFAIYECTACEAVLFRNTSNL